MISELKIRNFKSLQEVNLKLGPVNLFVGTNASGKSNLCDVLRFLQGVGNGFSLPEILDGKPQSATTVRWDGIRGGSAFVIFRDLPADRVAVSASVEASLSSDTRLGFDFGYFIEIEAPKSGPRLLGESVNTGNRYLYDTDKVTYNSFASSIFAQYDRQSGRGRKPSMDFERSGPILGQIWRKPECSPKDRALLQECAVVLADVQYSDPNPLYLREYASVLAADRLGDRGENFAAVMNQICGDLEAKSGLLAWLRELVPDEIDDISILSGALQEPLFAVIQGNVKFPAPVLSDGTLRFAALAGQFFQKSMPAVLLIEEIEKGLHPSRLRLLLELMRSQSKRTGTQVFATTHSPTLLSWLNEEDRKTAFVCTRDAESGATRMHSLAEVPRLEELIKKGHPIDQLFEEGWLESALL